jgi:hypothetical protein
VSVIEVFCPSCREVHPHAADETRLACTGCGAVRAADEGLLVAALAVASMPPVQDMRDCPWCRETREVGHDCPAGAVGCTTRQPDETPCGCCLRCLSAMAEDFARHGSPSDIDTPWSST